MNILIAALRTHAFPFSQQRCVSCFLWAFSAFLLLTPGLCAAQDISGGTSTGTFITLQNVYPGEANFRIPPGDTINANASGVSGNSSEDWVFLNEGTINAGLNGGTGSGIVLGSLTKGAATVENSGSITSASNKSNGPSGIQFTNGGQVLNHAGADISGFDGVHADGGPLVVENFGDISGKSIGSAIYLGSGGTITNWAGGGIRGAGYGVDSNAAAANVTVLNHGEINTNDQAIRLYDGNVYAILNDTGALIKSGGGATVNIAGATGYLLNKGTIEAQKIGVLSNNTQGQNIYVNAGVITANSGPAIQTEASDANNTIYNFGTAQTNVADGDAILIKGNNTRLVLGASATLPNIGFVSGTGSVLNGNARSTGTNNDIILTDSGLAPEDARKLIGFRNLTMNGVSWQLDNDLTLGSGVSVDSGTLTLTGIARYAGPTILNGGTLALSGAGMLADTSKLSMLGGTRFDFSLMTAQSISLPRLEVLGKTAMLDAGGGAKKLDLSGGVLVFNLAGTSAGDIMLSADNGLVISASTRVALLSPPALTSIGDRVTLAENLADPPASAFTNRYALVGFKKYFMGLNGDDLVVELLGASSYRLDDELFFDPQRLNNINLRNGSDYLDRLAALSDAGSFDPGFICHYWITPFSARSPSEAPPPPALSIKFSAAMPPTRTKPCASPATATPISGAAATTYFTNNPTPAAATIGAASALASPRRNATACRAAFWASGFGTWASQTGAKNLSGYDYDSQGASLGYEYTFSRHLRIGAAAGYSRGNLRVDNLKWRNRPDILSLALYGVYAHESGIYAQGGLGYGRAWNDYHIDMLIGGRKTGAYSAENWSADLELGYAARLPQDWTLTPSAGLEYDYLRNGGWTENLHNNPNLAANRFYGSNDHGLDVALGLRLNRVFRFGKRGGFAAPEIRAAWVHQANAPRPSIRSAYAGAPGGATVYGVDPGKDRWRLGLGLSGRLNEHVDFRADYDFQTRSGFREHTVTANIGVSF